MIFADLKGEIITDGDNYWAGYHDKRYIVSRMKRKGERTNEVVGTKVHKKIR